MDGKYSELFGIYHVTKILFQKTIERIGKENFDYDTLLGFLEHNNSSVLEGTRRILLLHYPEKLSRNMLYKFRDLSGDYDVQTMALGVLEERKVQEDGLRKRADNVVALFTC